MYLESLEQTIKKTAEQINQMASQPISHTKSVIVPYRICPLGAHVDHQGGTVLGRRINAFTILTYIALTEPKVRLQSLNYPGEETFSLRQTGRAKTLNWGRYARGAASVLKKERRLDRGIMGAVSGSLPDHGLGSSASVGLAYLIALAQSNGIELNKNELISLDRQLENDYLQLQNGIMDQAVIVHSIHDGLVYIDTRLERAETIPDPPETAKSRFIVISSGFSRQLVTTGFNDRVNLCRQAAEILGRKIGLEEAEQLSQIPAEVFEQHGNSLPAAMKGVTTHYFSEVQRVEEGRIAWEKGDLIRFGQLMNESNQSSIKQYKSGSEPLKCLQEITSKAPGVYGSRFSGGGFGGCVVGLADKEALPETAAYIEGSYQALYPAVADKVHCYEVFTANGVETR